MRAGCSMSTTDPATASICSTDASENMLSAGLGLSPWLAGLGFMLIGVLLVTLAIPLGG